ncbi:MAG TPA: NADH-quinone oxidoreductase subunit A [Acidimicrobiales bacterium]|nr:NADH-quinone oxidoreductase subunit A [Acidimicrobiales bacterium]
MDQYLPILLILVLSLVFAVGSFMGSRTLGPRARLDPAKRGPYESGIAPKFEPSPRFHVRFYLIAMIFIIFDIEVVFLYPFAVMFHQLYKFGFIEIATFAAVVFVAFAYLVSQGGLDWGPGRRFGSRAGAPVARTMNATIRRVSRPGVPVQRSVGGSGATSAADRAGTAAGPAGGAQPVGSGKGGR